MDVCVWRGVSVSVERAVCVCVCFRADTEDLRPQAPTLQPVARQAAYILLLNSTLQHVLLAQSPEPGAQRPECICMSGAAPPFLAQRPQL